MKIIQNTAFLFEVRLKKIIIRTFLETNFHKYHFRRIYQYTTSSGSPLAVCGLKESIQYNMFQQKHVDSKKLYILARTFLWKGV